MGTDALTGAIRRAMQIDAPRLHDIRHAAISTLAPAGMPEQMARQWAERRSVEWTEQIIKERDVWVFDCEIGAVAWVSFTGSEIDGLYTDPAVAQRGVGSSLLAFAEEQIARRGTCEARLEASCNAEAFYLKRGWAFTGSRPPDGAREMAKRLLA